MTTLNQAMRTFNQRRATEAALTNEQITRNRVEEVERKVKDHERQLNALHVWYSGLSRQRDHLQRAGFVGFLGRLRWLVTGR